MSKIHQCNDGSQDITGRATPREYVPCSDSGGVVGQTPPPNAKALDDVGPSPTNEKDKKTKLALAQPGEHFPFPNVSHLLQSISRLGGAAHPPQTPIFDRVMLRLTPHCFLSIRRAQNFTQR